MTRISTIIIVCPWFYFVGHLHVSPNSALGLWGYISFDTPDQRSGCSYSFCLSHIVPSFWLRASAGSWLPPAMIAMPPTSLWEQPIAVLRKEQGRILGKARKSFFVNITLESLGDLRISDDAKLFSWPCFKAGLPMSRFSTGARYPNHGDRTFASWNMPPRKIGMANEASCENASVSCEKHEPR